MATNKNITMKQFNGTDYDTLYPKTIASQVDGVYNKTETLSATTAALLGGNETMVPDEAFVALKSLINGISASSIGAARIELGNYTGTGANAETAITLTFSFKPKVVIVAGPAGTAIFMQGAVSSKTDVGSGDTGAPVYGTSVTLTWSGNSVTWKGKSAIKGENILNKNGVKYYYVTIG